MEEFLRLLSLYRVARVLPVHVRMADEARVGIIVLQDGLEPRTGFRHGFRSCLAEANAVAPLSDPIL
jgi:hypothetical protein